MIKKITFFLVFLVSIFTLCSFTTKIVEVGVINDNTTIYNDLMMLGLTPSDYITLEATQENDCYDEEYLIAVGENRKEDNSTDVYLYLYNPVMFKLDYAYMFELNINNSLLKLLYVSDESYFSNFKDSYDIEIGLCEYSSSYNIAKLKFNYINHVNERKYDLDQITRYYHISADYNTYYLEQTFNNPFTATFKEREEDGQLVSDFEYNSFIYITKDEIVQLHFDDLTVFKDSSMILYFLAGIFGGGGAGNAIYFYNFNSSKKIEQIIETDINYKLHIREGYYSKSLFDGDIEFSGTDDYKSVSTTIYSTDESEIMVYEQLEKFEAFKTPSRDRLNEFTDEMNITDEVKNKFTNYQHSICFLVATNNDTRNNLGEGFVNISYVEDFKISRLKFETDGRIYNSYVADDLDDGGTNFDDVNPTKTWFDELLDWILDNPLYFVLIIIGLVVLLPLIIALLPTIVGFLVKIIIGVVTLPFKLISSIIDKIKRRKKTKEDKYI